MFLLIFIVTIVISAGASMKVRSSYAHYAEIPAGSGMSGAETAQAILRANGIHDVEIIPTPGTLSDHYNPMTHQLVLSEENYYGRSLAAVGVAAHETGHAIQHSVGYFPLQLRSLAVGVTNFASQLVTWLPIIGIFTRILSPYTGFLLMAIGWGIIMAFNIVTLPVEYDASRRGKIALGRLGVVADGEEARGVEEMLNAAALTYVAAFITSLLYFMVYLLPLLGGRRRDD